jgi:TusA-related sulfurtransferase
MGKFYADCMGQRCGMPLIYYFICLRMLSKGVAVEVMVEKIVEGTVSSGG